MANGKKYTEIIEQFEGADDAEERQRCLFTMVKMVARNDIHHIWGLLKVLTVLVGLDLFLPDTVSIFEAVKWLVTKLL